MPLMLFAMKLDEEMPFEFVIVNVTLVIGGFLSPLRVNPFVNLPRSPREPITFVQLASSSPLRLPAGTWW